MAMINLNIRVDEELKKEFESICDGLGVSMSTAINMYIKSVIRDRAIKLDLSLKDDTPKGSE